MQNNKPDYIVHQLQRSVYKTCKYGCLMESAFQNQLCGNSNCGRIVL